MIKKLFSWIVGFFVRRPPEYLEPPKEIQGTHDCALRALYITLPNIPIENMISAFNSCCDWWPYRGISNKEFNIALAFLEIKDRFDYVAAEPVTLDYLLKQKGDTFIALIYGHYTVASKGYVLDSYSSGFRKQQVYCYWRLK